MFSEIGDDDDDDDAIKLQTEQLFNRQSGPSAELKGTVV